MCSIPYSTKVRYGLLWAHASWWTQYYLDTLQITRSMLWSTLYILQITRDEVFPYHTLQITKYMMCSVPYSTNHKIHVFHTILYKSQDTHVLTPYSINNKMHDVFPYHTLQITTYVLPYHTIQITRYTMWFIPFSSNYKIHDLFPNHTLQITRCMTCSLTILYKSQDTCAPIPNYTNHKIHDVFYTILYQSQDT